MKKDKAALFVKKCLKLFHIKVSSKTEKLLIQIFKFGIVGGIAFIIDYLSLIICKEVFHLNTLLSVAIAFTISVIYNYIASVKWVFDVNKEKNEKTNFIIWDNGIKAIAKNTMAAKILYSILRNFLVIIFNPS